MLPRPRSLAPYTPIGPRASHRRASRLSLSGSPLGIHGLEDFEYGRIGLADDYAVPLRTDRVLHGLDGRTSQRTSIVVPPITLTANAPHPRSVTGSRAPPKGCHLLVTITTPASTTEATKNLGNSAPFQRVYPTTWAREAGAQPTELIVRARESTYLPAARQPRPPSLCLRSAHRERLPLSKGTFRKHSPACRAILRSASPPEEKPSGVGVS